MSTSTNTNQNEVVMLPIGDVGEWELNPRRGVYRNLGSLLASIREEGIKDALHVWFTEGRYVVLQGNRRLKCAIELGIEVLPCVVEHCAGEAEALRLLMELQLEHDAFDPLEEATGLETMVSLGMTSREVATGLNRSEQWVQLRLDALKLPDNGKEAYGRGVLDLECVQLLMQLDDAEERREAVEAVVRPEMTDQPLRGLEARRAIEDGWVVRAAARREWTAGLRKLQKRFPRKDGYTVVEEFAEASAYCNSYGHPERPWRHADEKLDRRELVDESMVIGWDDLARRHEAVIMVVPAFRLKDGFILLVNESVLRDAEEVLSAGNVLKRRGRSGKGTKPAGGDAMGGSGAGGADPGDAQGAETTEWGEGWTLRIATEVPEHPIEGKVYHKDGGWFPTLERCMTAAAICLERNGARSVTILAGVEGNTQAEG